MAILAKNESGGGDFYRVPPGTYLGRCFSVIDMGTHDTNFEGQARKRKELRVTWEIPSEMLERDGQQKPAIISKTYTKSLNKKAALRHDLESWRGRVFTTEEEKGFDVSKLLGVACTLTIGEGVGNDGNTRSKVVGVGKLGKGMTCPPQINPSFEYSVSEGRDNKKYEGLPDWLKTKLCTCLEWTQPAPDVQEPAETAPGASAEDEEPLPF